MLCDVRLKPDATGATPRNRDTVCVTRACQQRSRSVRPQAQPWDGGPGMRGRARVQLACAALAVAVLVGLPLSGVPILIRLPAVLAPTLVVAFLAARPWRWTKWDYDAIAAFVPSNTAIAVTAMAAGALLAWIVLTRFQSGDIDAIDFTVYFDRPLYQTA